MTKIPLLVANPQESYSREGSMTPTPYATTIGKDAQSRFFWQVAKPTTNLFQRPAPDSSFTVYATPGVSSISYVNDTSFPSGKAVQFTKASSGTELVFDLSPSATYDGSDNLIFSAYARCVSGDGRSARLYMRVNYSDGTNTAVSSSVSGVDVPIGTSPTRLVVSVPVTTTKTVSSLVGYFYVGSTSSSVFRLSSIQLESGLNVTPYTDGSLGSGYAWSGVANNSASTRAKSLLSVFVPEDPMIIAVKTDEGVSYFDARDGHATVGTYGEGYYHFDSSTIQLGSSRVTNIMGVAAFKEELTQADKTQLESIDVWSWENLLPRIGGVLRTDHSQVVAPEDHINALPTLHLPLEGSLEGRTRNGTTTATVSGALRWIDGPRAERTWVSPLLVASPDRTEDSQGSISPILAGSVSLGQGQYGQTWKIKKANTPKPTLKLSPSESRDQAGGLPSVYEETTNLIPDPSHESGTISPYWVGTGMTLDTSQSVFGSTCLRVQSSYGAAIGTISAGALVPSATVGDVFTLSVYAKGSGSIQLQLHEQGSNNGVIGTLRGPLKTLTEEWKRYSVTFTITSVGTYFARTRMEWAGAIDAYFDGWQLERKTYASPYVDGSLLEGSWTGTPHQSWSTRARGANLVGAVRPTAGTRTLIEEGTTNLLENPSFETAVNHYTDGFTKTQDSTTAMFGSSSMRLNKLIGTAQTAPYVFFITPVGTVGNADVVTVSMYVKANRQMTDFWRFECTYRNTAGAVISPTHQKQTLSITTDWTRLTFTLPAAPVADTSHVAVSLRTNMTNILDTDAMWVDGVQIEKKPYATSYCDGSLGPLYAWTGTAHNSASVRKSSYSYTPPTESGWFIEEGTTNYYPNPIAANAVGGNLNYTNITISRITDAGLAHPTAGPIETATRITATGTTDGTVGVSVYGNTTGMPVSQGTAITVSMWFRASPAYVGQTFNLRTLEYGGATAGEYSAAPTYLVADGSWQYITNTITIQRADRTSIYAYLQPQTKIVGAIVDYTAVQFEAKPYSTSFCHGDMGTGYAWTGTAHNSSSIRDAAYIAPLEPLASPQRGEVHIRLKFNKKEQNVYPIDWGSPSFLGSLGNSTVVYGKARGVVPATVPTAPPVPLGEWFDLGMSWDDDYVRIYVNGQVAREGAAGGAVSLGNLTVGQARSGSQLNGEVNPVRIFPRPLTAAERSYVIANPLAAWEDLNEDDGEVRLGFEGTENFHTNPVLATGTTGWSKFSSVASDLTATRVDTQPDMAPWVWQNTLNSVASSTTTLWSAFSANIPSRPAGTSYVFTCSVDVKANRPIYGATIHTRIAYVGSTLTDYAKKPINIMPYTTRVETDAVWSDPTKEVAYVAAWISVTGVGKAGDVWWMTNGQVEEKAYATPFVEGVRETRGDVSTKKFAAIRYKSGGTTPASATIRASQTIGSEGYAQFRGSSLILRPLDGKTLEVESVAVYEHNMEDADPPLTTMHQAWTYANTSRIVNTPVPILFAEEGTTNLFPNPVAALGTYSAFAARGFIDRVETDGVSTSTAFRLRRTDPAGTFYFNSNAGTTSGAYVMPVASTDWVTISTWVKAPAGTAMDIRMYGHSATGTTTLLGDYQNFTATGQWQYVTITRKLDTYGTGITGISFYVVWNSPSSLNDEFYLTDIQVEQKQYPTTLTPQFDAHGRLQAGYSWTGVPHESSSVRESTSPRVRYSPSAERGAYAVRFRTRANRPPNATYVFSSGTTATTFPSACLYAPTSLLPVFYVNGANAVLGGGSLIVQPDVDYTLVYEWEGTSLRLYLSDGQSRTFTIPANRPPVPANQDLRLGHYGLNSSSAFGGLLAFDRPLTEAERTTLFESETWEWENMQPRIGAALRQSFGNPILVTRTSSV